MTRAVLIVNAVKADSEAAAALHETVTAAFAEAGWPKPEMLMTTPEDGGAGFARAALASGAELVVACGGDGTVNAVAGALAGTGAVLGVLSLGTGNLLAANLGIPGRLEDAVAVLTAGTDRRIDVGVADGDRVFVAMAGLGLDAAMIADTPEPLKARVGWPAYIPSIVRHLRDRGVRVTLRLEGRRVGHARVRALVIGNVGRLHAGIDLLPEAVPDDGLLDVVVLEPHGRLAGWLSVTLRLLLRRDGAQITRYRAGRIEARTRRPVDLELDGDAYRTARLLSIEIRPGALLVRVPAGEASATDESARP
jgi:YegS/Rv2252/BmrU family lipid kinase